MSVKDQVLKWIDACEKHSAGDLNGALAVFLKVPDAGAKISFNIGCIYLQLNQVPKAIEHFTHAVDSDHYLAVAYMMRGVAQYYSRQYQKATSDFSSALDRLRDNDFIDYTQIGLPYKMFRCEIIYNRALSYDQAGNQRSADSDMSEASRLKNTDDHIRIDRDNFKGKPFESTKGKLYEAPASLKSNFKVQKGREVAAPQGNNPRARPGGARPAPGGGGWNPQANRSRPPPTPGGRPAARPAPRPAPAASGPPSFNRASKPRELRGNKRKQAGPSRGGGPPSRGGLPSRGGGGGGPRGGPPSRTGPPTRGARAGPPTRGGLPSRGGGGLPSRGGGGGGGGWKRPAPTTTPAPPAPAPKKTGGGWKRPTPAAGSPPAPAPKQTGGGWKPTPAPAPAPKPKPSGGGGWKPTPAPKRGGGGGGWKAGGGGAPARRGAPAGGRGGWQPKPAGGGGGAAGSGKTLRVKVHGTDTRVLAIADNIVFDDLYGRVCDKFQISSGTIKFKDSDGDLVTMSSQEDLDFARGESPKLELWLET